ncbi:beta strand repeat-containing protein [Pedobacter punctiformis]|uniref:Collagen triple helix repeat-containing protein n=1 Tax=Pedobacter punctiformis TaxID=3004097 RepID=A0ABT4L379_9SPHI|nr:hypothetical protein [Pedobacter sp. HCMS5-2]MCZ4242371.1 hypothetical protein [Pedobacter sp. HCMS5-2]
MNRRFIFSLAILLSAFGVSAQQKVKDGTVAGGNLPNKDAILELESSNKGFLHTRVALKASTNAFPLSAHVAGMMVYNTATENDVVPGIYYNDGTKWVFVRSSSSILVESQPGKTGTPGIPGQPGGPGSGVTIVTNDSGTWVYNPTTNTWTNISGGKGADGKNGTSVTAGPNTPVNGAGSNGDTYINTSTGDVYTKEGNVWVLSGNIKGPKGDNGKDGIDGKSITGGSGAPGLNTGANGDSYVNTTNGDVYTKQGNTWVVTGNIKGLKGDAGVVGVQGMPGASGAPGTPGSGTAGAPGTGVTIVTNDSGTWVYNPTTNTWTNINGPKGDKGDKGDAGVVGVQGMPGTSGAPGTPGSGTPGAPGTGVTIVTNDSGTWVYNPTTNTWTNINGPKGDKGDAGVVGVQGMPGTSGAPGIPGSGTPGAPGTGVTIVTNDSGTWVYNPTTNTWTNINGPKGDKGDKGDAGVVGVQGMPGTSGAPGTPGSGTAGAPGTGVTIVTNDSGTWVYNPTTNTWTNINGPKGDKGDAGVVGVQGMPGTSGAPGIPGSGTPGAPGTGVTIVTNDSGTWVYNPTTNTWTNINGPKGDKGDKGDAGIVGVQGMPGTSGTPGTPGSGTPGAPGTGVTIVTNDSGTWVYNPTTNTWTNINGPKGDKGDAGVVGVQGMPGTSGTPGTPGSGTAGAPGTGVTIVTNDSGTWVYNPTTNSWTNINGPKGDKGDAGVVGVQGMPGTSGTPGTPGSGTPGAPGTGVTIVTNDSGTWVYNPTTNTWTNINGPKGDKGDAGVVGVQGMPGTSGAPGTPGSGTPGAPGTGVTIVTNDSGTWVYNPTTNTWTNINGPKGDKGDKGDAGVVGVQGMPGTSGTPGTPGSGTPGAPGTGVTIVTNDSGTWVYNPTTNTWTNINGPKGDKGDKGDAGVVGVQGMPGTSGAPGTPGSGTPGAPGTGVTIVTNDSGTWVYNPTTNTWTNINGPKGDKGDAGVVGVQGMPGTSGAPGTPGSGTPGAPGTGVTIVTNDSGTWVYNPTTNTWTNINGPKGDKGDTGAQGPIGLTGAAGPAGAQGIPGANGVDGAQGPIGPTGAPGAQGPQGDKGDTGAQGPIGLTGAPGATGAQGPKGDTGTTGAQGPIGLTGAPGAMGPQGPKGDTGTQGGIGLITNGLNTIVTGNGTTATPYQINTKASAFSQDISTGVITHINDATTPVTSTAVVRSTNAGQLLTVGTDGGALLTQASITNLEPWQIQGTANKAILNTDNIYQQGKVSIGSTSATPATTKQLEVVGDLKAKYLNGGNYYGVETGDAGLGIPTSMMYVSNNVDITAATATSISILRPGIVNFQTTDASGGTGSVAAFSNASGGNVSMVANNPAGNITSSVWGYNDGSLSNVTLSHARTSAEATNIKLEKLKGVSFDFNKTDGTVEGSYTFPRINGATNQVLTTPGGLNAQLVWKDINDLVNSPEPLQIQGTTDKAIANTDNVYQMGTVAIAKNTALAGSSLDVKGAVVTGTGHVGSVGLNSFIIGGNNNVASGENSIAGGFNSIASGDHSIAIGTNGTIASGYNSKNFGATSTASQANAFIAGGINNTASAINTFVSGQGNRASGQHSFATGQNTIASSIGEVVTGLYNAITTGNTSVPTGTDAAFQIGNGTSTTRSNAITVLKNGSIGTDLAIAPTERLDIGSKGVRIRDINTVAYTGVGSERIVVADASGVLKTISALPASAIRTETANYSAVVTDETILIDATSAAVKVTLPAASASIKGKKYTVKKIDTTGNGVNVISSGGTIDGNAAATGITGTLSWQGWVFQCDGVNWFIVSRI